MPPFSPASVGLRAIGCVGERWLSSRRCRLGSLRGRFPGGGACLVAAARLLRNKVLLAFVHLAVSFSGDGGGTGGGGGSVGGGSEDLGGAPDLAGPCTGVLRRSMAAARIFFHSGDGVSFFVGGVKLLLLRGGGGGGGGRRRWCGHRLWLGTREFCLLLSICGRMGVPLFQIDFFCEDDGGSSYRPSFLDVIDEGGGSFFLPLPSMVRQRRCAFSGISRSATWLAGLGSCGSFQGLELRSSGGRWTLAGSVCFSSRRRLRAGRRAAMLARVGDVCVPVCVFCNFS
ncbi:hypothetical protein PVAP13_8KG072251 [Panicum virgatum]|uniref:Uncharacterized protein n=1 Tax=Panicum virgatum TaxID=38727 RepID=A0A8T0PJ73_PANVG|nr:hypothetical protein PVAP13_8KG072251 [Panicum virgatum]